MRIVTLALAVIVVVSVPHARADMFSAKTEHVLRDEAARGRKARIAGGIALFVVGGGAIAGGIAASRVDHSDELIDFSPVIRAFGYGLIGTGALSVLAGGLSIGIGETQQEKLYRGLRADVERGDGDAGARRARARVASLARDSRRTRRIVGGVGIGLLVAGGAAIATGAVLHVRDAPDTHYLFYAGGGALVAFGTGFAIGSRVQGKFEEIDARLPPVPSATSATIVPAPGGALLSFSGAF